MACGCTTACGCVVTAGAGILVQRIGDEFIVTNTAVDFITAVDDTDCIGLSVLDGVLSASLIIDSTVDACVDLTCGPLGLYATLLIDNPGGVAVDLTCSPAGLAAAILFDNSSGNGGVAIGLDGLNNLYTDLVLDPASPTELSVSASGLSVADPRFVTIAKWGTD